MRLLLPVWFVKWGGCPALRLKSPKAKWLKMANLQNVQYSFWKWLSKCPVPQGAFKRMAHISVAVCLWMVWIPPQSLCFVSSQLVPSKSLLESSCLSLWLWKCWCPDSLRFQAVRLPTPRPVCCLGYSIPRAAGSSPSLKVPPFLAILGPAQ